MVSKECSQDDAVENVVDHPVGGAGTGVGFEPHPPGVGFEPHPPNRNVVPGASLYQVQMVIEAMMIPYLHHLSTQPSLSLQNWSTLTKKVAS